MKLRVELEITGGAINHESGIDLIADLTEMLLLRGFATTGSYNLYDEAGNVVPSSNGASWS